jgi:hypothetical protein
MRAGKITRRFAFSALFFTGVVCFLGTKPLSAQAQEWYSSDWHFRQEITIQSDHTDFGLTGNLTDFPMIIKITDGNNPLFGSAQPDGDDILFTASDGTTKLAHQIEHYDDTISSEQLDAWVRVPTFYSGSSTVIYMYYGNASASNQEDAENVWDDDFKGVWHLDEDVTDEQTSGKHYDSTSNDHDGSQHGNSGWPADSTPAPKMGAAQYFDGLGNGDGLGDLINVDNVTSDGWTGITETAWAYPLSYTSDPRIMCKADSGTPSTHIYSLTLDNTSGIAGRLRVRLKTDTGGTPNPYDEFMGAMQSG